MVRASMCEQTRCGAITSAIVRIVDSRHNRPCVPPPRPQTLSYPVPHHTHRVHVSITQRTHNAPANEVTVFAPTIMMRSNRKHKLMQHHAHRDRFVLQGNIIGCPFTFGLCAAWTFLMVVSLLSTLSRSIGAPPTSRSVSLSTGWGATDMSTSSKVLLREEVSGHFSI